MPGHVVHIEIARAFLNALPEPQARRWSDSPEITNALLHGALDPDMGLFPGGDPRVTDLAHHVKTADLARSLVRLAKDEIETAYAWGWVTHFIADTELHPVMNRACGEHRDGTTTRPMTWDYSPGTHIRVELGLDAVRLARDERLRTVRLHDFLDGPRIQFLQRAFHETHGIDLDERQLLRGHRVLGWAQGALFSLGGSMGRRYLDQPRRPGDLAFSLLYHPARWVGNLMSPDSIPYSLTHSLPPPAWLEEAVESALEELPATFSALFTGALEDLPNLNLDTGDPIES
jgi:hypothetical protein